MHRRAFSSPMKHVPTLVLLAWLLLGDNGLVSAQAAQPSLTLELVGQAPTGFDLARLRQRVAIYLGPIVAITPFEGETSPVGASTVALDARFVVRLAWPEDAMTPLHAELIDLAASPARQLELDVLEARSWDELERLVALKLGSLLRTVLAHAPQTTAPQTAAPVSPPPPAPQPEPAPRPQPSLACPPAAEAPPLRAVAGIGGGLFADTAFEAPRLGGSLFGGLRRDPWEFGMAASVTMRRTHGVGNTFAKALEASWSAALHHNVRLAGSSWLLQVGAEVGLFAARIEGTQTDQTRTRYAVTPLTSLLLRAGYALGPGDAVALLVGPALDLFWNRSQVEAGGQRVYDTGRARLRAELTLVLGF